MLPQIYKSEEIFDLEKLGTAICFLVSHYEKSAPVVAQWLEKIYFDLNENRQNVSVADIIVILSIIQDGSELMNPNYASNYIYKHLAQQGGDTTGMLGF